MSNPVKIHMNFKKSRDTQITKDQGITISPSNNTHVAIRPILKISEQSDQNQHHKKRSFALISRNGTRPRSTETGQILYLLLSIIGEPNGGEIPPSELPLRDVPTAGELIAYPHRMVPSLPVRIHSLVLLTRTRRRRARHFPIIFFFSENFSI